MCVLERKLKTSRPDEDLMYPELSNTVTAEAGPCVHDVKALFVASAYMYDFVNVNKSRTCLKDYLSLVCGNNPRTSTGARAEKQPLLQVPA